MDNNLEITFAGLKLKNPFLLASAPPSANGEMIGRAFAAGWAGAVVKTVIVSGTTSTRFDRFRQEPRPMLGHLKFRKRNIGMVNFSVAPLPTLESLERDIPGLKSAYPEHAVIGSIGGELNRDDWQSAARRMVAAGVDALELNFACSHSFTRQTVGRVVGENPDLAGELVSWVVDAVDVPVIAKLPGVGSDIVAAVTACRENGAAAVAGVNTLSSIIGVDLETFEPLPSLRGRSSYGGYSGPAMKPLALRWVSQAARTGLLPVSGIGGITTWEDAAEFILLGASTVQLCTAVMWYGFDIVEGLIGGMSQYVRRKGFTNLSEMVGLAGPRIEKSIFDLRPDESLAARITPRCTNCGLCVIACRDGAHQAIEIKNGRTHVQPEKCTGCTLCFQVCPIDGIVLDSSAGMTGSANSGAS